MFDSLEKTVKHIFKTCFFFYWKRTFVIIKIGSEFMRNVGTVVRGIRTPIIKENDDLATIVVDSLLKASKSEGFEFRDRDVVGITEAVVSISVGNYATIDDIATDIKNKFPEGEVGIVFPAPVSRNRYALILKGVARASKQIYLQFSYPRDEVGNALFDEELLEKYNINPNLDVFNGHKYNELFGQIKHQFTGINYIDYFQELVNNENCKIDFIFANDPLEILKHTKNILISSVHSRMKLKKLYRNYTENVYGTDDILTKSINGSGYNSKYGLLGSNKATEEKIKLFPENGDKLVQDIQKRLKKVTGKNIEVLVYGDGAFKDPVGQIWELADPVVSPAYTKGLEGTPNELKLKYFSDNKYSDLKGEELKEAIINEIKMKDQDLKGQMATQGTTPRQLTDLIGSLCDLTSGSGDKGTPVVYIQGYFDNYAS